MSNTKEKIYIGQTALRLNFSTGADLTGYTLTVISVRKPDGSTTATWTATIDDASDGSLYYDISSAGVLDVKGVYKLQPKITFSDDTVSYGTTTEIVVYALYD